MDESIIEKLVSGVYVLAIGLANCRESQILKSITIEELSEAIRRLEAKNATRP